MRADLGRAGVDPSVTFDCLVAVTEACSNALIHGFETTEAPHPIVSWSIGPARISFCIQDFSGLEWSKTAHPSREEPAGPGAETRVGGFGLGLMRGLMDDVEIGYRAGGTMVTMHKRLDPRPGP